MKQTSKFIFDDNSGDIDNSIILILSENSLRSSYITSILEQRGFIVMITKDPVIGLNLAKNEQPDLILIDIYLSNDDSFDPIKLFKSDKLTIDIPIIFLIGTKDIKYISIGLGLGAADYLRRPFNEDELIARIIKRLSDVKSMEVMTDLYTSSQQSLTYARYIQKAILPKMISVIKDGFVLLNPKEKLSGDFYLTHKTDKHSIIILGDCTGHGVPGALLVTISVVLLEHILKTKGITSPSRIMEELNNNLVNILKSNGDGLDDGLEMAVCVFDHINKKIEFSSAKRSLTIIEGDIVSEIKGDRKDIGGYFDKVFTSHIIDQREGMNLYMFSDGAADQMGGPDGKKFMKRSLIELFFEVRNKTTVEQKVEIEKALNNWKGNEDQTDDILIIGIKL